MDYVERIKKRYGLTTIKDAVDLALRRLAGEIKTTREEMRKFRGSMPDFEIGFKEEDPIEDTWPS